MPVIFLCLVIVLTDYLFMYCYTIFVAYRTVEYNFFLVTVSHVVFSSNDTRLAANHHLCEMSSAQRLLSGSALATSLGTSRVSLVFWIILVQGWLVLPYSAAMVICSMGVRVTCSDDSRMGETIPFRVLLPQSCSHLIYSRREP